MPVAVATTMMAAMTMASTEDEFKALFEAAAETKGTGWKNGIPSKIDAVASEEHASRKKAVRAEIVAVSSMSTWEKILHNVRTWAKRTGLHLTEDVLVAETQQVISETLSEEQALQVQLKLFERLANRLDKGRSRR